MPDPTAEQVEPDLADLGWAEVVHDTRSLDCIGRDHGACVWPENCVCPCHDVCTCATNDDQHDAERCHVGLRTPPGSAARP